MRRSRKRREQVRKDAMLAVANAPTAFQSNNFNHFHGIASPVNPAKDCAGKIYENKLDAMPDRKLTDLGNGFRMIAKGKYISKQVRRRFSEE